MIQQNKQNCMVLIVAKCIVNLVSCGTWLIPKLVLIVAKCIVNLEEKVIERHLYRY